MVKQGKYRVRRAFIENDAYITNDNVHTLSAEQIEGRIAGGYVEHAGGPDTAPPSQRALYLASIEFASDGAAEEAASAGLTADDFAGIEPSGKTGFTVGDVRALAHKEA